MIEIRLNLKTADKISTTVKKVRLIRHWLTAFSPNWISSTALQQLLGWKALFLVRIKEKNKGRADELPAGRRASTFLQTDSVIQSLTFNNFTSSFCRSLSLHLFDNQFKKNPKNLNVFVKRQTLTSTQRQQKKQADGVDLVENLHCRRRPKA